MENKTYSLVKKKKGMKAILHIDGELVNTCEVNVSKGCVTVVSWFTEEKFKHHGYGKETLGLLLRDVCREFGIPTSVKYVWNGENQYVLNFLVHLGRRVGCPDLNISKSGRNARLNGVSFSSLISPKYMLQYIG